MVFIFDGGFHEGESLGGGLVLGLITRYQLWAGFHDREFHGGIHPLRARPVPVVTWKHPWHEGTPLGHLVNTLEKERAFSWWHHPFGEESVVYRESSHHLMALDASIM